MPDGGEVRFIQGNCFQLEYIYAPPKNISGGFGVNFTTATNVITSGNNNPEETLRFTSFSMGPVFAINHKNTSIQIGSFFGLTRWNERLLYQRPESYPNKAIEVTLNGKTAFSINPSLKFKYTVIKGLFVFNTLSINILNTSIELSSRDPKDTSASIAKTTNTAHDFSNLRFLLGFGYNF